MKFLTVLAVVLLAGCQSGPETGTTPADTPDSVTYTGVTPETLDQWVEKAQAHCQQTGKNAYLPGLEGGTAKFYCV